MTDTPIRVSQIEADLHEARETVAEAQRRVDLLSKLLELAQEAYGQETGTDLVLTGTDGETSIVEFKSLAGMDAIDGMEHVLRESGTKMSFPEMVDEMRRQGWATKAQDPVETLRVAYKRQGKGRIIRVERGYYDLWERGRRLRSDGTYIVPKFRQFSTEDEED